MYDHITPTQWVLTLACLIPLTLIGFAIFFWVTMHPDEKVELMSRLAPLFRTLGALRREHGSHAAERSWELLRTEAGNDVPDLVEQLEALDDDSLLDLLAQLCDEDGEWRFAESRVAKFIPGRVEDRLAQVRDVRGTEKPVPPGRVLRVRDSGDERVISFR